ncbi:MAG: alpha/beta hydrolase family protein [Candidatus Sericytochromatia bacterium]|nr:alpha/beta hydrolase family protein [Candidatus Sericytochromatia bacterium]
MSETPLALPIGHTTLRGVLHLPAGPGPHPVVLWLHGFAGHRVEARRLFVEGARRLEAAGFASLRIDFRGCGESDGDFLDTTITSMVADAREALASLRAHPAVDPQAVTVLGFSLGATIACHLADDPGLAGLVLWSPVVFPVPIFARMGLYAAHPELHRQGWVDGGGMRVGRAFLQELAALDPLSTLAGWQRPLLVLWGTEDTVATPENAAALVEEVEGAEGLACPHGDHTFGTLKARTWLLEATTHWLQGQQQARVRPG